MPTKREMLVDSFWLEDMTFEGWCHMVELETGEKIPVEMTGAMRNLYNNGISTYAEVVKEHVWNWYGRTA